jgi:hypothetical protein
MNNIGKIITLLLILILFARCSNEGCMDVDAANYNPNAKKHDGLCSYRYLSSVIINKIPLIDTATRTQIEWDADYEGSAPDIKFYMKMLEDSLWGVQTNVEIDNISFPFMWKVDIQNNSYLHWNQTYGFLLVDVDFVGMDLIFGGTFIPSEIYKDDKIILQNVDKTAEIELDFVVY